MPEPEEVQSWWKRFVQSLRAVTAPLSEHRHEDQFLRIREAALSLAESEEMLAEISKAYGGAVGRLQPGEPATPPPGAPAAELAAMELQAFSLAVEVHAAQVKEGSAKAGALENLRKIGKTVLGSVGELFKFTDYGKAVLTVLKEILDFGGKD